MYSISHLVEVNKLSRTVICPNCSAKVDISTFYELLVDLGLEDGSSATTDDCVTCEKCDSELNVAGSCNVDVNVYIDEPKIISVGQSHISNLPNGVHVFGDKIFTVVDGEVQSYFSAPDENQFSFFE